LALNPNGKVPTLVEKDRVTWEADAVICRLAEIAGSDLWPRDERLVEVIRWFSWNAQHFYLHGGALFFEHIVRPRFGLGDADRGAVEQALAGFRRYAAVLDRHLANRDWLVGERVSVADFSVAAPLPYAEQAALPLHEFGAVRRWHERLNEIEAWRDPFPQRAS
jgi:glutathione S-transferase